MKTNFFPFFSSIILFSILESILLFESDFEVQYFNWDEKNIMASLDNTYIEVEASFGLEMDKFKLALDLESTATVLPDINFIGKGEFKKFHSSSFEVKQNLKYISSEKYVSGNRGVDTFQLGSSEPIIKNFSFVVASDYTYTTNKLYKYAFIGIRNFYINEEKYQLSMIDQLKKSNLIQYQTWFLNFESDSKGKFVVGTLPNIIYNNIYNESDMIEQNCDGQFQLCAITFQEIYYGKIDDYDNRKSLEDKNHLIALFSLNTRLIKCTSDFGSILYKNFFSKKIANKICGTENLNDGYMYFYCQKDKFSLSEMENVNFAIPHQNGNMTFVLEPKDLFYEYNNILYFLIIYKPDYYAGDQDVYWIIGNTFLQKYLLTFNTKERLIYFYKKKIHQIKSDENNNGNENNNNAKYIIIIAVISVLLIVCIAILIVYITKKVPRKKKANELDDEFDYQATPNKEGGESLLINENE